MSEQPPITVLIPAPLRRLTGGEAKVHASGPTIAALLDDLDARYPGLKARVCEEDGELRRFVNVFVDGQNARTRHGAATPLAGGEEVGIVPAMAGGSRSSVHPPVSSSWRRPAPRHSEQCEASPAAAASSVKKLRIGPDAQAARRP